MAGTTPTCGATRRSPSAIKSQLMDGYPSKDSGLTERHLSERPAVRLAQRIDNQPCFARHGWSRE